MSEDISAKIFIILEFLKEILDPNFSNKDIEYFLTNLELTEE
jgi:hypothetical protein